MPCPSHPPWLDHSNYTWRRVHVQLDYLFGLMTNLHVRHFNRKINDPHWPQPLRHPLHFTIHSSPAFRHYAIDESLQTASIKT
jgi:hypothetical protein